MNSFSCSSCGTINSSVLYNAGLVICKKCHGIVHQDSVMQLLNIVPSPVPDDWSFVRIGTEFQYGNDSLVVVGRIRFQLRNDYKNFWCGALKNGEHIWIMESFASFCILGSSWTEMDRKLDSLRAGASLTLPGNIKVRGEYVEKCEEVSYEGEVGRFKFAEPGFFLIQFSNNENQTAVFFARSRTQTEYLTGGKIDVEKLNLKNLMTWDEWK